MKQPMRLKSGGFISSGTDAGDLKILRTAKNIDDGSANGMKAGGKVEKPKTLKRVIKDKVKNKATDSLLRGNKNYPRKIVSDAKKLTKKEYPTLYKRAA